VVADDAHALAVVEAVGGKSLDTGVEVELDAGVLLTVIHEPVKELLAKALGTARFIDGKVIDIEKFPPGQGFGNVESGDRNHLVFKGSNGELIARLLLASNLGQEGFDRQVTPQLLDDRETVEDLPIGGCELNFHRLTLFFVELNLPDLQILTILLITTQQVNVIASR
jgi:hypothetical protein